MDKIFLLLIVAGLLLATGCTGTSAPVTPAATTHTIPTIARTTDPIAAPVTTATVPFLTATTLPAPSITITGISVGSLKTYTSTEFGFSLRIPGRWIASGAWETTAASGKKYRITFEDPAIESQ